MSSWKHALGGVAAVGLFALVPSVSGAASLRDGVDPSFGKPFEPHRLSRPWAAQHVLLLLSAKLLVVLPALYDGQ